MKNKWFLFSLLSLMAIGFTAFTSLPNDSLANDRFKQEFLNRINRVRTVGCNCGRKYFPAAPPLTWNSTLQSAAEGHANDMNRRNYFDHTSKDGRTIEDRITGAGYVFKGYRSFAIGENIAYGQESIAEVTDGWFKSEGHCHNLMNPDFKEVGVAHTGLYWVQDFGGRESFTPEQQKLIKEGAKLIIRKVRSK